MLFFYMTKFFLKKIQKNRFYIGYSYQSVVELVEPR